MKGLFYTNAQYLRNKVYIRGYEDGKFFSYSTSYQPTIYLPTSEESDWHTIHGHNLKPVQLNSIKDMLEYVSGIKDTTDVHGFTETSEQPYSYISELIPGDVVYDRELIKTLIIDIETETQGGFGSPNNPFQRINAITIWMNGFGFVTWGLGRFEPSDDKEYRAFTDEGDMLLDFLRFVWHEKPDIVSGWNIDFFDIPYIVERVLQHYDKEWLRLLSPWKLMPEKRYDSKDNIMYTIPGVTSYDYMNLYKKFCLEPRESYSLNAIAAVELDEKKIDYSEYDSMHDLYMNNWSKFIEYNIHDVTLVKRLDDKLKYFDLAIKYAYLAKTNFDDVFGTVKYWDVYIYNYLKSRKISVPPRKNKKDVEYPGGYVKDPIVGLHDWISTFDLNSLYPSIIVQWNISPETILERAPYPSHIPEKTDIVDQILNKEYDNLRLLNDNITMTANGYYFSREKQGFIAEMVDNIYNMRKEYKNLMLQQEKLYEETKDEKAKILQGQYNATQHALKIQINSLYGAMGNSWFRYFDPRMAEAITVTGQTVIKWTEKVVNGYLNSILKTDEDYVVGIDTDSVFVRLDGLVNKLYKGNLPETSQVIDVLSKFSDDKLVPVMHEGYKEIFEYLNCFKERLVIKNEVIGDKGIFVKRKRYVINVHINEGTRYHEPKLKVRGLEIVRTSTPESCRNSIREAVKLMFSGGEVAVQEYIKEFKKEFLTLPIESTAFPRGASEIKKWEDDKTYLKGTPIHVRGCILFNNLINSKDISDKYLKIEDGSKIKFVYLVLPNPIHENVISFPNFLPPEFDLHEYVDYETQFEKAFIAPLKTILDAAGWSVEPQNSLDDLFS